MVSGMLLDWMEALELTHAAISMVPPLLMEVLGLQMMCRTQQRRNLGTLILLKSLQARILITAGSTVTEPAVDAFVGKQYAGRAKSPE
ncbi:hypothetical protein U9M48_004948 [Paspalum notatum var. saurae]|uniref:Uncharacterized protein n=1 Tax=Paspalum notatum var. saurae TaxID=547442 RepID=A0AAQ3PR27_PASNO